MESFQSDIVSAEIPPHWSWREAGVTYGSVRRLESILGVSGIRESTL